MLYLLHFDPAVGRAVHYLGVTAEENLQKRLRRHACGHGATLTREAVKRGSSIYLARSFPGLDHKQERLIKNSGHLKHLCPICCPALRPADLEPYKLKAPQPRQIPFYAIWGWPVRLPNPEPPP